MFLAEFFLIEDGILGEKFLETSGSFLHVVEEQVYVFGGCSYYFVWVAVDGLLVFLDVGLGLDDKLFVG